MDADQDCVNLKRVHQGHADLAGDLLKHSTYGQEVRAVLGETIKPSTPLNHVFLAHQCKHFHLSYPVNRFLVHLVDAYLQVEGYSSRLLPNHRVISVESAEVDHKCHLSAEDCSRHSHFVHFTESSCSSVGSRLPQEEFQAIILRHGLTGELPALSRQILPYGLPCPD